jgi:hypothetical protein
MDTAGLHVMVLPLPAQGHVTPLMELSHRLDDHGFEVTFGCTEPVINAMRQTTTHDDRKIHLVSIPDGLSDGDDRRDLGKVLDALSRCVPGYVEDLIGKTKVKWLVADTNMGALCFEVAKKLGVRVASFFPASAACLGTLFRVPKLIEDGFFDDKGMKSNLPIFIFRHPYIRRKSRLHVLFFESAQQRIDYFIEDGRG